MHTTTMNRPEKDAVFSCTEDVDVEHFTIKYYRVHSFRARFVVMSKVRSDGSTSRKQYAFVPQPDGALLRFGSTNYMILPCQSGAALVLNRRKVPKNRELEKDEDAYEVVARSDEDSPAEEVIDRRGLVRKRYVPLDPNVAALKRQHAKEERAAARKRREVRLRRLERDVPVFGQAMSLAEYKADKVRYPCIVQPKMDGCRIRIACVAEDDDPKIYIMSQNNNVRHFWYEMQYIICKHIIPPGMLVEGEFWSTKHSWQELVGLFHKKTDPINAADGDAYKHIRIVLFDMIDLNPFAKKEPYKTRFKNLQDWFGCVRWDDPYVIDPHYKHIFQVVESKICKSERELDQLFDEYTKNKQFEGVVIRDPNGLYNASNQRTFDAMKRKHFEDAEYKVVDLCCTDDRIRLQLKFRRIDENGKRVKILFGAMWSLPKEEREKVLGNKEKYIGQYATVVYTAKTQKGIPRAGEVKGMRLDHPKVETSDLVSESEEEEEDSA